MAAASPKPTDAQAPAKDVDKPSDDDAVDGYELISISRPIPGINHPMVDGYESEESPPA